MGVSIDTFQFIIECISDVQLRGWIMKGNTERMLQLGTIARAIEITEGREILQSESKSAVVLKWTYCGIGITANEIGDKTFFQCDDTNTGTIAISDEQNRLTVQGTIADAAWCGQRNWHRFAPVPVSFDPVANDRWTGVLREDSRDRNWSNSMKIDDWPTSDSTNEFLRRHRSISDVDQPWKSVKPSCDQLNRIESSAA